MRAPQVPSFAILRSNLVQRLDDASTSRVTHISAPAGYGKSVLLGQWVAVSQAKVAWIDIDPLDNNATHLARSIVDALRRVDGGFGASLVDPFTMSGSSLGDDFVAALIDDLALRPHVTVVFDNLELLREGAMLADLSRIMELAPPNIRFIVATRSDAAIGLNRLRVRGELAELRQSDLAMDEADAAELIRRVARIDLGSDAVEVLVRRTEGWPAGLQLAALSLRGRDDPEEFIRTFSGDDRHVAEYLTDEVLARQSDEMRQFLVDTSVLLRLSGPLCDAVTGRTDSQRLLEGLDRGGMLIARLDDTRSWFRYHPLLRDLLRYDLLAADREHARELLGRAAEWHEGRDEIEAAGQYVLATEDWSLVGDFVSRHGRTLFERDQSALLVELLGAIPARRAAIRPVELLMSWATALLIVGRSLAADEELTHLLESRALSPWQEAAAEATRAAMLQYHLPPGQAFASGRRALECLAMVDPDDEPVEVLGISPMSSLETLARVSIGEGHDFLGEVTERAWLLRCGEAAESTYRVWLIHSTGALAHIAARDGELDEAAALASRALEVLGDEELVGHPASATAHLALGSVARDRNQLARAALSLDEAHHRIRRNRRFALLSVHAGEAALLALAQGELEAGFDAVLRTRNDGRPPPPPAPAARLAAVEARLHLAGGDVDRASHVLRVFAGLRTGDIIAAEAAVAVAQRDVPAARKALDNHSLTPSLRERVERAMWTAIVDELDGDSRAAREHMTEAVALAAPMGMTRVFLDARVDALRVLRVLYRSDPTSFLREVVDQEVTPAPTQAMAPGLVDQLSDRELIVLQYLPSRMSNPEIAQTLYVSVNTLKTHLKHIYRKLDVANRSEAIARAESLRLL